MSRAQRIHSFDGTEWAEVDEIVEPDRRSALLAAMGDDIGLSVRGAGLNYALASAGDATRVLSTRHLDRLLHLDTERRLLTLEPGVEVGTLVEVCLDHGFWFPVLPGYPRITVGGAAAANIHGKAQHGVGHFIDHLESLRLVHPDHGELLCSRTEHRELFELTVGGFGLTGVMVELTLRLEPLGGPVLRRERDRVANLLEAVEMMQRRGAETDIVYSWNDLGARGSGFGKGVVYSEHFEPGVAESGTRYGQMRGASRWRVPLPAHNRLSAAAMGGVRDLMERRAGTEYLAVRDAAFPINGLEIYFHLYGRRGFHECQIVLAHEGLEERIAQIQGLIRTTGAAVTLGSLKLFEGDPHLLWFAGSGVCLTIDAPATEATRRLFAGLDRLAMATRSPVNLAKDSRLGAVEVRSIFPGYDEFARRLHEFDPARRFDTALRRRLDV